MSVCISGIWAFVPSVLGVVLGCSGNFGSVEKRGGGKKGEY